MTKEKKSPKQQQPSEDIPMADNKDIMTTTGIKMKYISRKMNMALTISLMCLILHLYNI